MIVKVREEVKPFIIGSIIFGIVLLFILLIFSVSFLNSLLSGIVISVILSIYMVYFFRNPDRFPPKSEDAIVAPADGHIAKIKYLERSDFDKKISSYNLNNDDLSHFGSGKILRVSIFLSLFDVHVNRSPVSGTAKFLGYFPGKRLFTFDEKSSDYNQHNAIFIKAEKLSCLITQIVGPVCRRVVYWLDKNNYHNIKIGQDFGMMKFGSRLDIYFPADSISLQCELNHFVRAGETVIATMNK